MDDRSLAERLVLQPVNRHQTVNARTHDPVDDARAAIDATLADLYRRVADAKTRVEEAMLASTLPAYRHLVRVQWPTSYDVGVDAGASFDRNDYRVWCEVDAPIAWCELPPRSV